MTNNKNGGMSPVAAGGIGLAVGTLVGATAAVLANEDNREAIKDKFNEVKGNVEDKVQEMASDAEGKIDNAKKAVAKKLDE